MKVTAVALHPSALVPEALPYKLIDSPVGVLKVLYCTSVQELAYGFLQMELVEEGKILPVQLAVPLSAVAYMLRGAEKEADFGFLAAFAKPAST